MTSTAQLKLKVGHKCHVEEAKAFWLRHNQICGRDHKTVQNTNRNGCQFFSICYSVTAKGWKKATSGCRAHIHLIGKSEDNCEIVSMDLQHTCDDTSLKRKQNYQLKDIALLSEAVEMYQPTSNKDGNARQLKEIIKASTGFNVGRGQAYRFLHERSADTIHAQIGQYMLLPDLFKELEEQDPPDGTFVLENKVCSWNKDMKQFRRSYIVLSFMKHF